MDSVELLFRGLASLFAARPEILRNSFRRGRLISYPGSDSRGIQCRDADGHFGGAGGSFGGTWVHGADIMEHLKQV